MTERSYGASSASFFSQAEIPAFPAFRRHEALLTSVTLIWMTSLALSRGCRTGRPRPLRALPFGGGAFFVLPRTNFRLLSACSVGVAHRQLPGSYPISLLILSMLVPGGLSPMSARN